MEVYSSILKNIRMKEDKELTREIEKIIKSLKIQVPEISFALIDLNGEEPMIAGFNMDKFIYPASIYKIFIAAEILRQADAETINLDDKVEIRSPNDVYKDEPSFFPRSTRRNHRLLLRAGDKATLDYFLDLMLTRSDNTAANVLLDIAGRENINKNIILPNGWQGSEVTRKFLDRLKEEKEYRVSKITVSCARHLAELFYKTETRQLVNERVSSKLKEYMMRRDYKKDRKKGLYLPDFQKYYSKGGWLEINQYKWNIYRGVKAAIQKGYAIIRYSGDAGVVKGENSHYSIAMLTILKTKWPWQKFPMRDLSKKIYNLMESRR
ncbi:MAG: serine hydrolase [bacterium]|nr:serine hydrolase [bacterium]